MPCCIGFVQHDISIFDSNAIRLSVVPTYRGQACRSALHRIFLSDKWKSWHTTSYLASSGLLNLLKLVLSVSVQVEDAIHNCLNV